MLQWRSEGTSSKVVPFGIVKRDPDVQSVGDLFRTTGIAMKFARNSEVFGEDEPADYIYQVVSGAIRISKLMSDGRRQIGAFYLPGDLFGLESDEVHNFAADAIGDCTVRAVKRSVLLAEAPYRTRLVNELWAQTMQHLQRAQEHILLLGRKNAQERIAAFLLDMAARLSRSGDMELPMPRQDIADYLGLTIETVSRTLTQLERDGLIAIPAARRIVFRNRAALDVMNDSLAA
jgi:CRP/FNR family transcriptional regulator, nitrogen fixation regulation protein